MPSEWPIFADVQHWILAWAATALLWALDRWHVNRRAAAAGRAARAAKLRGYVTDGIHDRLDALESWTRTPNADDLEARVEALEALPATARLASLDDDLREHVAATAGGLDERLGELAGRVAAAESGLASARAADKTILDAQSHYDRRLGDLEAQKPQQGSRIATLEEQLTGRIDALRDVVDANAAALEVAIAQAGAELMRLYEAGSYAAWRRDREEALQAGQEAEDHGSIRDVEA